LASPVLLFKYLKGLRGNTFQSFGHAAYSDLGGLPSKESHPAKPKGR
jgi:hypothetical protein